MFIVDL
ncbi:unnamed protein product [Leptidea sinapis]|nr:unnamed protein product [Leptidea sinapis]